MEKYENLGLVGEGSYGMVLKCKHKDSGQLVAIKKFLESEEDKTVKKIAMREVRMLKQLRHDHLVNLLEVFRRKKRLYLVFEFVDHTVLDELEKCPNGLDETTCRKILWQVLKGIEFCHHNNIIHRDIKPENILVSKNGIVKLCDFGFARTLAQPGEIYTDYVATRWYRAPELLVGDTKYGKAVDIWAVGCLLVEMLTGEPLFPGDSDIDQLYHIVKVFGNLTARHKEVFLRNPLFVGMRLPEVREVTPLEKKFPRISQYSLALMKECLKHDPEDRPTCSMLLKHEFFTRDGFAQKFTHDLKAKITREQEKNPLINTVAHDKDDDKDNEASNNKTTTRKKKKIALVKKDSKAEADKNLNKGDNSKASNKDVGPIKIKGKAVEDKKPLTLAKLVDDKKDTKNSQDDKSKRKLPDASEKGASKKSPPVPTKSNDSISLPPADPKNKPGKSVSEESDLEKTATSPDKLDKHEKHEKGEKTAKSVKTDKSDRSDPKSRTDKSVEDVNDRESVKVDKDQEDTDAEVPSDSKLDVIDGHRGAESKADMYRGEASNSREKEKLAAAEREKDKENVGSYKDTSSIPPIHQSQPSHSIVHNSSVTPSIPNISSPNMVANSSPHIFAPVNNMTLNSPRGIGYPGSIPYRVNDKMVKKQTNFKKTIANHHSVVLSPQPLQSEKSHLHDKSLEKLRTQKRETTTFDMRRDKEMVSFPEVRGAEAAPMKMKGKNMPASQQRSNVATIPHITNISDPFPNTSSTSQVETHSTEKVSENNLPSV